MNQKKVLIISWIILFLLIILIMHSLIEKIATNNQLKLYIQSINHEIHKQFEIQKEIKSELIKFAKKQDDIIPILLIACNRETFVRTLNQLINLQTNSVLHPLYVSFGCTEFNYSKYIDQYRNKINILKHDPPAYKTDIANHMWGYYKISSHYYFALTNVFNNLNHKAVIIVEDDFDIAYDFYDYFKKIYPLLEIDSSVWCISAWNDNGLSNLTINDPKILYRTDFFPGLGWLLKRNIWEELKPIWPEAYWDDWLRRSDIRKNRVCIRPEVSRVYTFGDKGVSSGQYFKNHLSKIMLNKRKTQSNTDFHDSGAKFKITDLEKINYDAILQEKINNATLITYQELLDLYPLRLNTTLNFEYEHLVYPTYRIPYSNNKELKLLCQTFGLMSDFRGDVARTSYQNIIVFTHNGHQIYLNKL